MDTEELEDRTKFKEADKLFEENMPLARRTLYKIFPNPKLVARKKGLDLKDLEQYAYTGLWKACLSYDSSKGTSFRTHAINNIRWHLIEKAKREGNPLKLEANKEYKKEEIPKVCSLDKKVKCFEGITTLHELIPSKMNVEKTALSNLVVSEFLDLAESSGEAAIVKLKMEDLTYDEIGERMGGYTGQEMRLKIRKLKQKMKEYKQELEAAR